MNEQETKLNSITSFFLFHCYRKADVMQKGNGLSGSLLLESSPNENLDERFPAKSLINCE
jgi:hypothetical protein